MQLCVVTVVVPWLIVVIYCPFHGSGVRVTANFQIISHLMGQLGLEVRVSVSFQSFALRMSVLSCFCRPLCQKGHFSVPPVLTCFRETPQWQVILSQRHGTRTSDTCRKQTHWASTTVSVLLKCSLLSAFFLCTVACFLPTLIHSDVYIT